MKKLKKGRIILASIIPLVLIGLSIIAIVVLTIKHFNKILPYSWLDVGIAFSILALTILYLIVNG